MLLFSDLPIFIVGGLIVIWYIYQVVAGIVRHIRTNLTGGDHKQFGSYVKKTVLNNVSYLMHSIQILRQNVYTHLYQ